MEMNVGQMTMVCTLTYSKHIHLNTTLKPELANFQVNVICVPSILNISEVILATDDLCTFRVL